MLSYSLCSVHFLCSGCRGIVGNAFVFALLCAFLVFGMSWLRGMTPETMILTGIALMYLFSAMTATLQFTATEEQLAAVVQWTFGTLNGASWSKIGIVAAVLLVAMPVFLRFAWPLNAMASGGEEVAKGLGIETSRVRIWSSLLSVLVAAAIISFTGVIGFVGLVAPHIARLVIGGDHRYLIPYSALFGAILLLSADTIGRSLLSPAVIPVGIVVSYLGVPLFIQLILTRRKEYFQ
ncbi:FecCD family ABC transporter permease [Paenibacillus senegalensis]|uniref:FecCD family ABC transporter permease n=1 Tax=Paenibacillus senegalensis TaxID=1465766 RepID=UPI001F2EB726|nr:iron ABC transporter permease [Paenibacillus senegalensis]